MRVNGKHYRTVWMEGSTVYMIEQNLLPFRFSIFEAKDHLASCHAIRTMVTRGAGAIGATAGFAMAQALLEAPADGFWAYVDKARKAIEATRPTARNLFFATQKVYQAARISVAAGVAEAQRLALENENAAKNIGMHGESLLSDGCRLMTHCNAGWLGFVDYGSALAPIYAAVQKKKSVFVWVDETRPRSQGARLTAWELQNEEIDHLIVPDNAGAHLMAQGKVDLMIVGADRIAANGDTANKIGTLEKAIVAHEFGIPFYVAAPFSTFDMACETGEQIPIEERTEAEVLYQTGPDQTGQMHTIRVGAPDSKAYNPAFDVTPARYIRGIITEKGIVEPNRDAIRQLFEKEEG